MKRVFIAVGLLIITAAICFYGTFSLKKETEIMINTLNETVKLTFETDNIDKVAEKNQKLENQWQKSHNKLACIVMHTSLQPIEENISGLQSCIVNDEITQYRTLCMNAVKYLKHLEDSENLSFENIF